MELRKKLLSARVLRVACTVVSLALLASCAARSDAREQINLAETLKLFPGYHVLLSRNAIQT